MIDRLPTPFGLVRAGVAPDHPKIKNVIKPLREDGRPRGLPLLRPRRGRRDDQRRRARPALSRGDLGLRRRRRPASLGIPGEDLPGSHAATEFVAWYNGHPDFADREFDLDCERVVVIGNGNVAADVARMLVLPREELEGTDTADYAIEALAGSSVKRGARPGPPRARAGRLHQPRGARARRADRRRRDHRPERGRARRGERLPSSTPTRADATNRKNIESFPGFARASPRASAGKPKRVELRFLRTPARDPGRRQGRADRRSRSTSSTSTKPASSAPATTDETETIECGMVLRSIGYLGTGIDGVPYDAHGRRDPERPGPGDRRGLRTSPRATTWSAGSSAGRAASSAPTRRTPRRRSQTIFEDAAAGRLPDRQCSTRRSAGAARRARDPVRRVRRLAGDRRTRAAARRPCRAPASQADRLRGDARCGRKGWGWQLICGSSKE